MTLLPSFGPRASSVAGLPAPEVYTYSYTGSDQTKTVPAGAVEMRVKIWGAGAGAGSYSGNDSEGGGGGFTDATFPVSGGETILIQVGGRGGVGPSGAAGWPDGAAWNSVPGGDDKSGGSGGSTRIWRDGVLKAVAGGGGACGGFGQRGGAGGGTAGQNAKTSGGADNPNSGTGGTQSAGGYDAGDSGNANKKGLNITSTTPARTGGGGAGGAPGGGGWWGGGGGGSLQTGSGHVAPGGGGSGYIAGDALAGATYTGDLRTPAGTGDPDYPGGVIAYGAQEGAGAGGTIGHGYAWIEFS